MRRSNNLPTRLAIAALVLAPMLGGCSDIYFDRRETVTFYAGDAPKSNVIAQTIDPWPPAAANRRIEGNGERGQKAAERYRTNKVTPLQPISTSSAAYQNTPGGAGGGGGGIGAPAAAAGATP